MVASHHERFDGSGYPKGLKGGEIPLLGRIAAIIDFYDAVTSDRPFAEAMSPHAAIKYLYTFRNTHYQDELIEQFIQTIGTYPVGTLVELNTGEVAIVIEQNQVRRLLPKVVVVHVRPEVQRARIAARDGLSEAEIEARIQAQMPLEEKVQRADHTIDNNGDPDATRAQVEALYRALTSEEP